MWPRIQGSPVPAHTTFESDGATASAPMEDTDLVVEERLPVNATINRLPNTAGRGADVVDKRIAGHASDRGRAVAYRSDEPPADLPIQIRWRPWRSTCA